MKPRLIDANEFAIEEPKLWDWSSIDGISSTAVLKQCIWDVQCAPVVDAIPVEWIEKQIEKYATFEFHLDVDDIEARACLEYLLENWRKENEEMV